MIQHTSDGKPCPACAYVSPLVVTVEPATTGHGNYFRVTNNGHEVGQIQDASYKCWDGSTREQWVAFGGGSHLGNFWTQSEAIRAVTNNANNTRIHWHGALVG